MALRDLRYEPMYVLPRDDYVNEVLISSLKQSTSLDCMFGFFNSSALQMIAPGLAEYLARTTEPMRLIASPNISEKDMEAIRDGVSEPSTVIEEKLKELLLLDKAKLSTSALERHTLACLAYMLSTKRLLFRVAWLRSGAMFHPKVWFFRDGEDTVVAHGSSNLTTAGLSSNHEQISVDASWDGDHAAKRVAKLTDEFNTLWNRPSDHVLSLDLPTAIQNDLIREYKPDKPPTENEFKRAWEEDATTIEQLALQFPPLSDATDENLTVPSHLDIHHGPFAHQGEAVERWEGAKRRGILSMATGSGKTITALVGATRLQQETDALLIVISAPYKPLISQWVEEVAAFGVNPLPTTGSSSERADQLNLAIRSLRTGASRVQVAVVTENFLTSRNFRDVFDASPSSITSLLIADEVHNLGKKSFISDLPERFDYRLGLSATPERQYDPEGTDILFKFFGPPVFEFSLTDAIGVCLVPYNYYIHQVGLNDDEFSEWLDLTERLARKGFKGDRDASETSGLSKDIERLLMARRRIIESAENKVHALRKILEGRERDSIKHVLIYATDKNPAQLQSVNDMLQRDLKLKFHEITARQTTKRSLADNLINRFVDGDFNALTCKRVLDEGVDIPQVAEAFILASNTVRRQWIQRRGRVLRRCDATNKQLAHIHDFIVVPPNERGARSILKSELDRAEEFAKSAHNSGTSGGPLDDISRLDDILDMMV